MNTQKQRYCRFLLPLLMVFTLGACGGGGGSSESDSTGSQTSGNTSGGSGTDSSNSGGDGGPQSGDSPGGADNPVDLTETPAEGSEVVGDVETINLGFASLTSRKITLPGNKMNAKEVYQLSHYIGRTDGEASEHSIETPIRSYQATCDTNTASPRMFVSVTVADSEAADAATSGSVYELKYNPATKSFDPTGNSALLPMCYESHGIAVSENCGRVAVLCNTEYQASKDYDIEKDLIELYGTTSMKLEDNHGKIDAIINSRLAFLIVNNSRKYLGFFESLNIADYLSGLQTNFPENNFNQNTTFGNLFGSSMEDEMNYVIGQMNTSETAALHQYVRDAAHKENDQIWLLEWNNQTLGETPKAYVVDKMHGGSHTGAQELIYVDNDSQGRATYGFSVTHRIFDQYGDTHYSAGLTVINRNDWSMKPSGVGNRGWWWNCGHGHVINIRAFYNPDIEEYGAICTNDGNGLIGSSHGHLGSISVKMEGGSSNVSHGFTHYFVPATNAWVSNGGGHTTIPVDAQTNLSLIVAPRFVTDADMNRFLDVVGADMGRAPGTFKCSDWNGWAGWGTCYMGYMAMNMDEQTDAYPSIPRQHLFSDAQLDSSSLTRVGIAKTDEDGQVYREGYTWIVQDNDCQISDPQLIDLKNGRYLLGYAKFQCISDNLPFHRYSVSEGSERMLKPKSYYLMEIDIEGNVLAGPVALPNQGWGGIDEPMYLGNGKVGWTYISNPLISNYGGGQQDTWDMLVYHSNSVN